jgi:hypothetical protein
MKRYIHDRAGWPDLKYDENALRGALAQLHRAQGRLFGKLDALGFYVQNELLLNMALQFVPVRSKDKRRRMLWQPGAVFQDLNTIKCNRREFACCHWF